MTAIRTIVFSCLLHSSILPSRSAPFTNHQNGARGKPFCSFFGGPKYAITPTPPISTHFSLIGVKESSVSLTWKSGNDETNDLYDVKYKLDHTKWISGNVSAFELVDDQLRANVTNLHPSTEYEFGLFRRPTTIDGDWPLLESLRIRTADWTPYRPPTTNPGSFRVERLGDDGLRAIRVFWQPLPKLEHNGYGFHYRIKVFEEGRRLVREISSWSESSSQVVVADLSLKRHTFLVDSANYVGASSAASAIRVPAQAEILRPPASFVLEFGDGTYEYDWRAAENTAAEDVVATLVRCKKAGQSGCDEIAEYVDVEKGATSYKGKFDQDETVKIILSSATSASGLVEPTCRTSGENLGKMGDFPEFAFTGERLEIRWPLMCPEHGIVKGVVGYNVFFCVCENNVCVEPEMKETLYEEGTTLFRILDDVRPNKVYRISSNVVMEGAVWGPRSAAFYVNTSYTDEDVNSLSFD